jgi:Cu(I)-responsive transcriptional regulator
MSQDRPFTIGALARATGTKVETIRYYEQIGLLPAPSRTGGNYRAYSPAHLDRLGFIRRSRELGFSIEAVRELLRLADQRDQDCGEVDRIAQAHLIEVERKIADLARLAAELRDLSAQCQGGTIAQCGIIEILSPRHAAANSGSATSARSRAATPGRRITRARPTTEPSPALRRRGRR